MTTTPTGGARARSAPALDWLFQVATSAGQRSSGARMTEQEAAQVPGRQRPRLACRPAHPALTG